MRRFPLLLIVLAPCLAAQRPDADYLTDDVQYFPAGPEFKLHNLVEAAKKQAAEKKKVQQGF